MMKRSASLFLLALAIALTGLMATPKAAAQTARRGKSELSGLATISGTVKAPADFKAAKVYFRNVDKRIQYMVYTAGGKFRAMYLLPGNYEMRATARGGLESQVTKLVLKAGKNPAQTITMEAKSGTAKLVSMSEMFPPGPGGDFIKNTCFACHGPEHFSSRHMNEKGWDAGVEEMVRQGNVRFSSPEQRQEVVSYLAKNFGPNSGNRQVKFDHEVPLDESVLSKAMYIEYYFKPDPPGSHTSTTPWGAHRVGQDPHFDQQGNVYVTDRAIPTRLNRLDPRTGDWKEWVTPHPEGELHGLTIDKDGIVWFPERPGRRKDNDGLNLLAFDPKTEKFTLYPIDPEHKIGDYRPHTPVIDPFGNVWTTIIRGDRFFEWERETKQIKVFETPSHPSAPYGDDVDSQGNFWMALSAGPGRVGKYDPKTGQFTEYRTNTQPARIRRVSVDLNDRVWFGIYSRGIIGYVDPETGKVTEIPVPLDLSRPYDIQSDYEGNMWFGDDGQGGTTIKYNPKTNQFSYYPTPQVADQPKLEITRDGAIWYCPRSGAEPGTGVLYPDVSKITTLGAYYPEFDAPSSRRALRNRLSTRAAK